MPESLAQVFSCEFCEISQNTLFHRTPLVDALRFAYFRVVENEEIVEFCNWYVSTNLNNRSTSDKNLEGPCCIDLNLVFCTKMFGSFFELEIGIHDF